MARKAKQEEPGEQTELDRIMDDVAPLEDETEAEERTEEASGEDSGGDPREADSLPGQSEGAGDAGASGETEPVGAAASDASPPAEGHGESRDVEVDDHAEREKAGLLAELKKARLKAQEAEAEARRWQMLQQSQNPPQQPAHVPQGEPAPEVPGFKVVVSDDGQSVYVPHEEIEKHLSERVAQTIEQRLRPTPEQIAAQQVAEATQSFVSEYGEAGQQVAERAHQADELITLRLKNLMAQGHQVTSIHDATRLIREAGIDEEVQKHFPEMALVGTDEFVEGMASGNAVWRKSLLSRMAAAAAGANGAAPANGAGAPAGGEGQPLKGVAGGPRSLARAGGSRSQAPTADQSEFRELEGAFHAKPWAVTQKQYDRMRELGKKLGAPGYDEM